MSPRYLLILGDDGADRVELIRRVEAGTGLALSFANRCIAALVDRSCQCLAVGEFGCVLGTLFHRHGPAQALCSLTPTEAAAIAESDGATLLTSFWGSYVCAIDGSESTRVVRDPSGNFPCYFARADRFVVFAADAELLVRAGVADVAVDYKEIGRQLFRAFVPVPATALEGIKELLAGFALRFPPEGERQEQCWNPWDHVGPRDEDPSATMDRLSRTIRHSVHAIASGHGRLLLSLSGGLDSSIVAACLAGAAADFVGLTMFTDDPSGDERAFARAICDRLGVPLIERSYRLEDVDLDTAMSANLPRPRDRLQALAFERVHYAVAAEVGASAFITGNGGDHVFGFSQSAAPVADRYLAEGLSANTFSSLLDVCRQTGCNMVDAIRQAWHLAHARPDYRVRPNPLFLHPDFVAKLGPKAWHHPWLDAPPGTLPGKAAHVATILRVQPNLEPSLGDAYPVLNPLVAQPIVETCLEIPSWAWRADGRDRSLVRQAFASDLPPIVLNRRVKGTPGRFAAQLLDHFRQPIRDRLLGGRLAAAGIVDAAALERTLAGERPVADLERVRILELASVEAWIDHWTGQPRTLHPIGSDIRSDAHAHLLSSGGPTP
ncbi:MAG TPA: asparagine synthase-related protein [Sphingomicrobium sp.]|nr:asparagine synthase-related protein [Sphingomicrobium sp.]